MHALDRIQCGQNGAFLPAWHFGGVLARRDYPAVYCAQIPVVLRASRLGPNAETTEL